MSEILLIRHGETDWNLLGRFRGRAKIPLNAKGLWDADATAQRIAREWELAAAYSSPVRRALQTAEIIAAAAGRSVQCVDELADVDYGQWEGLTRSEAGARDSEILRAYFESPGRIRIPGGETFLEAQSRAVRRLISLAALHESDFIAVVAHTEINRLIILGALGAPIDRLWRIGQDTCAINLLRIEERRIEVLSIKDRCHLTGPDHRNRGTAAI